MKAPQGGLEADDFMHPHPVISFIRALAGKWLIKPNVVISPAMLWSGFLAEVAIIYSKKERSDQVQISTGTLA